MNQEAENQAARQKEFEQRIQMARFKATEIASKLPSKYDILELYSCFAEFGSDLKNSPLMSVAQGIKDAAG